jgi:hypothetical protein
VDVIDLDANQLVSHAFAEIADRNPDLPLQMFASQDRELTHRAAEHGASPSSAWLLTFDHLLSETSFVPDMQQMLTILHDAYAYPVDIEYTVNFFSRDKYKINLVQCRPLQVAVGIAAATAPAHVEAQDLVLEACGAVIGQSRVSSIDRVIYVPPRIYGHLPNQDRYTVARLMGRLLHLPEKNPPKHVMLVGPGRWGTTTPSLGVPVNFAEIDTVSVLCEIVAMREDLVPDVSLGTHFFNDLVELDILYLALFPGRAGNAWSPRFFEDSTNRLPDLLPDAARWSDAIRVIDLPQEDAASNVLTLWANTLEQKVLCYFEPQSRS